MLVLLSPAKKQQFGRTLFSEHSEPPFREESQLIAQTISDQPVEQIQNLMKINHNLAEETADSYRDFTTTNISGSALSVYNGPAFSSLDPFSLTSDELNRAQKQLIVLSGLYGVLHADTEISPYRLEMGLSFQVDSAKNLYAFWKEKITQYIEHHCVENQFTAIVNCASGEYSKAIDFRKIKTPIITCDFKEIKSGVAKSVSSFAKQARGLMARWIIQTNPQTIEELRNFAENGYHYSEEHSTESLFCFVR